MTVDCQWIEKNLEAFFCDTLNESESRLARTHIESCESCRKEAVALNAIDPLIKNHFQRELEIARRPRAIQRGRVLGLSGAGAAVVAALLILFLRVPQTPPTLAPLVHVQEPVSSAPAEPSRPVKVEEPGEVRAKPATEAAAPAADRPKQQPPAPPSSELEFQVVDQAGYSHTLDEYRGHVVVIAVWNQDQKESIRSLERLYRTYAGNPKFRFLGISHERQAKPGNSTFPMLYNQGSRLFGAEPGEFVMLDEKGTVQMRGSLVTDIEALRKALQEK